MALYQKRILVVEDDKSIAEGLRVRLQSEGFQVYIEETGEAALKRSKHPLDLVILDLKLPDMSGLKVCSELRRMHGPWLPVLILTAMDKPVDQLHGFGHGADAYLTKPYNPRELLQTVQFLTGSTGQNSGKIYLSIEEVAKRFGVNTTTVYRMAQRGILPGFKMGSQWRFSQELLETWIADQVTVEWLKSEDRAVKREAQNL